jgi:hypothetical protein
VRRARSRAERRAGLAGALPLFCTQRWASAKMQDAACRHGPAGSRELESFGKATLHGQGRALGYTSRSLGHCGLVMEGPAREAGSGTRSSRRSARAGEARVSRAVATFSGVAGRKERAWQARGRARARAIDRKLPTGVGPRLDRPTDRISSKCLCATDPSAATVTFS